MPTLRHLTLCLFIIAGILWPHPTQAANEAVKANYENRLPLPPASNPYGPNASSAAFFNGHNSSLTVPGTATMLSHSSFGQTFSSIIPFPDFINSSLNQALEKLYCEYTTEAECQTTAAFRYKTLLYGSETVDSEIFIRANFDSIADYWDEAARQRALQAAEELKGALRFAPWDRNLRHALLDIYYDITVADIALAREKKSAAYEISLEILAPPPGSYLINQEIDLMEEALALFRRAMLVYMELLHDPMGIDVESFTSDPAQQSLPFGYYLFQNEVPIRSPLSPLFKDAGGNWVLPMDKKEGDIQPQLFEGYKDLVLLFTLQKEYVQTAAELAKHYILRSQIADENGISDAEKASKLIGSVQQQAYLEGNTLLNIFPDITDSGQGSDAQSGLVESIATWRSSISTLQFLHCYMHGDTNLLGFTDDFLVLVQSTIPGDSLTQYFNSYDFFNAYLTKDGSGPLSIALTELNNAKVNYATYRGYQDQLATQFHDKSETYDSRLRFIVGVNPGEPGYDTPELNTGSEIWQQQINIELALKKIEKNQQEVANLQEQIEIEIWRRGQEHSINNAIGQVYIDYGTKQAELTKDIATISGNQSFASSMAAAVSAGGQFKLDWGLSGVAAHTVNAAIQQQLEIKKGQKQAEKEKLAARQAAEIQSLNDQLLDATSKAQIKTWLLRMSTLALESVESAFVLEQELGRLTALYNEKDNLERQKDEHNQQLAERYFADPSHRLLKDNSMLRAELAFEDAQKWLYLTIRAAEYKWNKSFSHTYLGKNYTRDTLLKLRNSRELNDMYNAIAEWDALISIGTRNDDAYKKFSFRQDFLGYYNGGIYPDPLSGEMVQPWQAFQSYISQQQQLNAWDLDNPIPGYKVLKLTFNTGFMPESGNFFLMNRWLEKIQYMKVKVFGGAVGGIESMIDGYLVYGDNSFIRTQQRGTYDPESPDLLQNEITTYTSRYWHYDSTTQRWVTENHYGSQAFQSGISVQVSNDTEVPPSAYQINTFKEYSVASSNWTLYLVYASSGGLPKLDLSTVNDIEIHFYSYWYARN
ncbi:MAG: hypothetical protein ABIJ50_11780 [Pseudomonadota bacterium]